MQSYNKSEHGSYYPLPEVSPYSKISDYRIKNTKFVFKKCNEYINSHFNNIKKEVDTIIDIGCGNGELIYYLSTIWKKQKLTGIDITPDFIDVANKLNKDIPNTNFETADIFDLNPEDYKSDAVCCASVLQIFPDPEDILNKLIDIVDDQGILVISSRFNPHDVSLIIQFREESVEIAKDVWRCDFNLPSEKWIKQIISKRDDVKNLRFEYPVMTDQIPKKDHEPITHKWTVPNPNGGYDIVNGMQSVFNPAFLILEKK